MTLTPLLTFQLILLFVFSYATNDGLPVNDITSGITCKGMKKEDKKHIGEALEAFSKALRAIATESVDTYAAVKSLVNNVEKDLKTMVTALEISKNKTQAAERETRRRSLKTSAQIAELKKISKEKTEEREILKTEKANYEELLNSYSKTLTKYKNKEREYEDQVRRLEHNLRESRLSASSCRVKRSIFDDFVSSVAEAFVEGTNAVGNAVGVGNAISNTVVEGALTVGQAAEAVCKQISEEINSILEELDNKKAKLQYAADLRRSKQKQIDEIQQSVTEIQQRLRKNYNTYERINSEIIKLKDSIDSDKQVLKCLIGLEEKIGNLAIQKSQLFTASDVQIDAMNYQIRLSGTVEVMKELLNAFEENFHQYSIADLAVLRKAKETLSKMKLPETKS